MSSVQPVQCSTDYKDKDYDGVLLVSHSLQDLPVQLEGLKSHLQDYGAVDSGLGEEVVVVRVPGVPCDRLVYAPTGPVNRDYDDVRRFSEAAANGIKRAMKAGMQRPLLVCPPHNNYEKSTLVAVLGALQALYMPLELREVKLSLQSSPHKVAVLGVWVKEQAQGQEIMALASALESGRVVYRDIGGSDPERMAAPRVAEYVTEVFRNTCVQVSVRSDVRTLEKEYPCLAAVNRCASTVPRHQARVIHLEYKGEEPIQQTLMLVGKGVTYDTGGADIKAGGCMAGMHRDKCGSAAVAGFFQILAKLKPKHLKVMGAMAMVRNSVGSDCYVADELIVSRAGRRIRVGNTDAEGRMAMVDLLCEMKEKAAYEVSPHMFTIATLTGHAIRAMGPHYSIILDNGAAHRKGNALQWQKAGEVLGDMFEVSTLRREDYEFHKGKSEYEEVLQACNLPSTATPRGHQSPAAFLVMASGLDKHGLDSDQPLPFSHIDIAGSSGPFPGVPTGAPLLAMATKYILQL
ncbi:putative aminopeptidase W07G4.4 [Brachyhypopomus gauderio]|uniref:putative aminopeptidase W07G4.4 n=1 Tax=Brachyhypopomus gauderio TaxID=698409 RepID=UPI0040417DB8